MAFSSFGTGKVLIPWKNGWKRSFLGFSGHSGQNAKRIKPNLAKVAESSGKVVTSDILVRSGFPALKNRSESTEYDEKRHFLTKPSRTFLILLEF